MALSVAARRVVQYPEAVLRAKAVAVTPTTPDFARLVADMLLTVAQQQGLGLGAPQVNESLRLFVMRQPTAWTEREARRQSHTLRRSLSRSPVSFLAVANPVILSKSSAEAVGVEACLSIPDHPCLVRRAVEVEVEYSDVSGVGALAQGGPAGGDALRAALTRALHPTTRVRRTLSGLPAVVFAHELDHLEGVLISDRQVRNLGVLTEADALGAATDVFVEALSKHYAQVVRS